MNPKISVIVPVYNAAQFLNKSLNSLSAQDMDDLEFICVNDGSKDNSFSILNEYAQEDQRFKIISQENRGVSEARNVGLQHAKGEYIMFLDSDDWFECDTCTKAYALVNGHDIACFAMVKEYGEHSELYYSLGKEESIFDENQCRQIHRTIVGLIDNECKNILDFDYFDEIYLKIYKRSIICKNEILFEDIRSIGSFEDGFFNIRYFEYVHSMHYSPEALYHYRKTNESSIITQYKPDFDRQWKKLFQLLDMYVSDLNYENRSDYEHALHNRKAFAIFGLGLNAVNAPDSIIEKRNHIRKILDDDIFGKRFTKKELYFMPVHFRVFFGLAAHKLSVGTYVLLEIMQAIREFRRDH